MPIEIPLTKGSVTLVDEEDYAFLTQFTWRLSTNATGNKYAVTSLAIIGRGPVYMHRLLLCPQTGFDVDHIDRNSLNNCRDNLRICTRAQNLANRRPRYAKKYSRYLGVSYNYRRRTRSWQAQCAHTHGGWYDSELEAAFAYDKLAVQVHGEFARPNFPEVA